MVDKTGDATTPSYHMMVFLNFSWLLSDSVRSNAKPGRLARLPRRVGGLACLLMRSTECVSATLLQHLRYAPRPPSPPGAVCCILGSFVPGWGRGWW